MDNYSYLVDDDDDDDDRQLLEKQALLVKLVLLLQGLHVDDDDGIGSGELQGGFEPLEEEAAVKWLAQLLLGEIDVHVDARVDPLQCVVFHVVF